MAALALSSCKTRNEWRDINNIIEKDPYLDGSTPDVVIDDAQALCEGTWESISSTKGYGPTALVGAGCASFSAAVPEDGVYEVYTYQRVNLPGMTPVAVYELSDGRSVKMDINDVVVLGQTTSAWHPLAEVTLSKGETFTVTVRPENAEGKIYVDAVMLVKK